MKDEIVLYQPDATIPLEVRLQDETVWLPQQQMAMLFDVKENNITYHIQGIYKAQKLEPEATTQKNRVVRLEGNRKVTRSIDFYNLIVIDAYVDVATFEMMDVRAKGVKATIYSGKDLTGLRELHNGKADTEPIDTAVWSTTGG